MYAIFTNDADVINLARSRGAQISPIDISGDGKNPSEIVEKENETLISDFLIQTLHIPVNLVGFMYLKNIIMKAIEEEGFERKSILSTVCKYCAVLNGSSVSRVERAIRHAIEVSYNKRDKEKYYQIFGTDDMLTNSEFICTIVNHFKLHIKH